MAGSDPRTVRAAITGPHSQTKELAVPHRLRHQGSRGPPSCFSHKHSAGMKTTTVRFEKQPQSLGLRKPHIIIVD